MGTRGNDDQHDGGDGQRRQRRQIGRCLLCEPGPQPLHHQSYGNGRDDHPEDAQKHGRHVYVDRLARQQPHQQRSHDGSQQRGDARHTDAQCQVATRQIGDDVRCRTAGAAAHQYDAHRQRLVEPERLRQRPRQQRHYRELCQAAHQHVLRTAEHHAEVVPAQRQSHAEHDDAQQRVDDRWLYLAQHLGPQHCCHSGQQHQYAHVVGNDLADIFHRDCCCFVVFLLFCFRVPRIQTAKLRKKTDIT